jgi:hypothetical protein
LHPSYRDPIAQLPENAVRFVRFVHLNLLQRLDRRDGLARGQGITVILDGAILALPAIDRLRKFFLQERG